MPENRSARTVSAPASLLPWLFASFPDTPRTRIKQWLKHGQVLVNGVAVSQHDHPLQVGDKVAVSRGRVDPGEKQLAKAGATIVCSDDDLVVIDKPAGLLSVATESEREDTAFARLHAYLRSRREGRPFVVHRIDRETSGLLLFAKSPAVRDRLQAAWPQVTKTYFAIVEGKPKAPAGTVENYLTEGRSLRVRQSAAGDTSKRAVTHYRLVRTRGSISLLQVVLETGRKHQIRVHLAGLGIPVIGDDVYGAKTDPAKRLGLHACRLEFDHPTSGRRVELDSALPAPLERCLKGS